MDIHADMCVDKCVDMSIDMCVGMCVHMRTNMCVGIFVLRHGFLTLSSMFIDM